jgi:pimeloyl-ACP methyl ester carboxylesterase
VLAPGFSGSAERPAVQAVMTALHPYAGVLVVDARGHGRSSGVSTLGDREVLDLDAAVALARRLGYRRVVTNGWSMGGSGVLRHAGLTGRGRVHGFPVREPVDAVVAVSTTSRWFVRDTVPMRRLHWLVETRTGRVVARHGFRVRIDPAGWPTLPLSPVELVPAIAPTPLLVVHGDRDSYFTVEHPRALARAAGEPTELWIVEGFGHAEAAAPPDLIARIGAHLPTLLARNTRAA